MRILQVASGDFFSTYGGGQVYVKNVVDEMIRQQCEVVVISFVSSANHVEKKRYKGIDLYEVGSMLELRQLVVEIHSDIIHAHSHKAQMVSIGQELGIPVVITSHHGGIVCPIGTLMDCRDAICRVAVSHRHCLRCVLHNTRSGLFWYPFMQLLSHRIYMKLGNWLQKRPFILFITPIGSAAISIANKQKEWKIIANGCSRMIAPCREIAETMERNGLLKEKIIILPHGIPVPDKVPPFPEVMNGNMKFFYVGRICYVKGLHILLEAFHRLEAPNAELHIIGGSGNKTEHRYEAMLKGRYDYDSRIVWHGKVAPMEVYRTISNYHVSSSSSFLEAFGLNIAESLAMGKPVLSTRNGGAEMQVEDGINGWLVPQNDVIAMKEKMQEIVNDFKEYDTSKSTERVISMEKHYEELWKIYSTEVNNKP